MKLGLVVLIFFLLFIGSLFAFAYVPSCNNYELRQCRYFSNYMETVYEDNPIFDKCLIVEDGEELKLKEYFKKHKFDGIEVRKESNEVKE